MTNVLVADKRDKICLLVSCESGLLVGIWLNTRLKIKFEERFYTARL